MAPIPEPVYLPPLDKCISGEQFIVSWETLFSAITTDDDTSATKRPLLEALLSDSEVLELLAHPFNAFPKPSPQTKTAFETKTSAINVTPSSSGRFSIKEVKEDALWLSKEAAIDEISALRIVVLECQTRSAAQLLGPFSREEITSIQDAAGSSKFLIHVPVELQSDGVDNKVLDATFSTQENRRIRALELYLSERKYLVACSEHLLQNYFYNVHVPNNGDLPDQEVPIRSRTGAFIAQSTKNDKWIVNCVKSVTQRFEVIQAGSGWFKDTGGNQGLDIDWIHSQLTEVVHTLEIIFQCIDVDDNTASSAVVLEWFRAMTSCSFFEGSETTDSLFQDLFGALRAASTLISLSLLSVTPCIAYLGGLGHIEELSPALDRPYLLNAQTILEIQHLLSNAADSGYTTASPVVFAWCSIMNAMRLRTIRPEQSNEIEDAETSNNNQVVPPPDVYNGVVEDLMDSSDADPILNLAQWASAKGVFLTCTTEIARSLGPGRNRLFPPIIGAKMRIVLLELIDLSMTAIGYDGLVLETTIAILTGGQSYWDYTGAERLEAKNDPIVAFLRDSTLMENVLQTAASRYPLEGFTFMRLVHAIALCTASHIDAGVPSIVEVLEDLTRFTYTLPDGFVDYETTHEEDNSNTIQLTSTIELFEPRQKSRMLVARGGSNRSLIPLGPNADFYITRGTLGRIVSESRPPIVVWFHNYSGLKYFGKLLETFLTTSDQVDVTTGTVTDRDTVAVIIQLLAALIASSMKASTISPDAREAAQHILEGASAGLDRSGDIISVIGSIFDEELQRHSTGKSSEAPLEVLISCVHFMHAILPISPGRVWPIIGRSGLLENGRNTGWLSSIVSGIEIVTGRYSLLLSCTQLFDSLVEDFASRAIARKCSAKSNARFGGREELGTGVPSQTLSRVLTSFTRYMVDVLESSCNWKFVDQEDRWCLVKNITTTLGNIVYYTYGIGGTLEIKETKEKPDPKEAKDSIIQPLKPAAGYIIETFLSAKSGTLRFQPLLRTFVDGFYSSKSTLPRTSLELGAGSVKSVLMFTKSLLHASTLLEKPTSQLESQLFKASPVVARLYAVHENYRDLIISVFEALIANASSGVGEPPSLLGHLGSLTSRNFLGVLSDLDNPLPHDDNVISVWQFLSTVVISRQNWFANYLLTGKTPRDALKKQNSESTAPSPHRSLLSHALETLSRIQQISIPQALAMLEFVSLAQNHFPWTLYDLQKHASFIKGITEFVGTLPPPQVSAKSEARIETCYKAQMAAYIAEILAMHLFHSRQMGNTAPVKELLPNLSYYTRFAVAIPDYNASLHGNLKRNFESRYPGCNLQEFQRTRMEHRGFGRDYFYDLPLADKMLSFDGAWTGRKNDGYGNELATANINMSLVDAQISVLKSWKVLAVELSSNLQVDIEVQKMTTKVVRDCLSSNIRSQFSEDIFIRLNQTRADLALVLLQRLIEAKSTVPELYSDNGRFGQGILALVWEAAGRMGRTFGLALTTGDATYYRTLLKLLFLALRIHADAKIPELDPRRSTRIGQQQTNEVVPLILEILDGVVANGFRDLAAALHDQPDEFFPEDIGLITGILQTCLRIPGVEFVHAQIVSMIAANNTARVATTLFSWSDKLAISGDPIYGELSIFFLLELSTMPAMAEYLAIEGILGQISSASITTYLRRGNVSPFADGAGPQRCYNIWVRGILPLLLNVLDAVGASVATEISLFLSQFPNLLSQSATAFDAPDTSRTATKAPPKYMTLSVVSEVHSLSLIFFILDSFRMQQVGITEIPEIQWDIAGVLENVDFWLSTRGVLRERILPMGKRELEMSKTKVEKSKIGATTRLEEAVVMELTGIRDVLSGGEA